MSHFTTIRTKIADSEILKQVLLECGYTYSEGEPIKGYKGQIDISVKTGSVYGIGFIKEGKFYKIIGDWEWVKHISGIEFTKFVSQITQKYAYYKVLSEAKKHNWTKVKEEKLEDGTIKIVLTKY